MNRQIIFHVPFPLNPQAKSASGIRPLRMLEAFKKIGYKVDVISGNATERKAAIAEIKKKIAHGEIYDFCYSESSTQPTLHTEPYSFIKHPFFEFDFFKFLKKHGIKIGLFYRDIYWCFAENIDSYKKRFYRLLYKYDLWQYNRLIDVLFVPSREMMDYVKGAKKFKIEELPAGTNIEQHKSPTQNEDNINFIYVGGIGNHYNLSLFLKVIKDYRNIHLILCCRKDEWEKVKSSYTPLLSENIAVVHASGNEVTELMKKADIGFLFLEPIKYRSFAMPFKLMEYIGCGLPVLSAAETKTGEFVQKNNCGWSIGYNEAELKEFLSLLNEKIITEKTKHILEFAPTQTWEARAFQVAKTLG